MSAPVPAQCPYCSARLSKTPKRKAPCPNCGKIIAVRQNALVTEDRAATLDLLKRWQLPEVRFDAAAARLLSTTGQPPRYRDVFRELFATVTRNAPGTHRAKLAYHALAELAYEDGIDARELQAQAHLTELLEAREWFDSEEKWRQVRVRVHTAGEDSCAACRALEGREFRLGDLLGNRVLPVHECSTEHEAGRAHGWCNCIYLVEPE